MGNYTWYGVKVLFTTFEAGCVVVFRCFFALQAAQGKKVALNVRTRIQFLWAYRCQVQPSVLFVAKYRGDYHRCIS